MTWEGIYLATCRSHATQIWSGSVVLGTLEGGLKRGLGIVIAAGKHTFKASFAFCTSVGSGFSWNICAEYTRLLRH